MFNEGYLQHTTSTFVRIILWFDSLCFGWTCGSHSECKLWPGVNQEPAQSLKTLINSQVTSLFHVETPVYMETTDDSASGKLSSFVIFIRIDAVHLWDSRTGSVLVIMQREDITYNMRKGGNGSFLHLSAVCSLLFLSLLIVSAPKGQRGRQSSSLSCSWWQFLRVN